MLQRDVVKDQIEQLGKVLAQITSKFMDINSAGFIVEAIEETSNSLEGELDLNLTELLSMDESSLSLLFKNQIWTDNQLDQLAELLILIGSELKESGRDGGETYYSTAINMLYIANDYSETFSLSRMDKIKALKIKVK